ncbi:hypothetical protein LBMAG48_29540 [Phycisphaerae bacterium]|nr:hypothetical protein LBMAG48_29540 [Phycisphaerae bacterium]
MHKGKAQSHICDARRKRSRRGGEERNEFAGPVSDIITINFGRMGAGLSVQGGSVEETAKKDAA